MIQKYENKIAHVSVGISQVTSSARDRILCYGVVLPWYKGTLRRAVWINMFTLHSNMIICKREFRAILRFEL